MKLKLRKISFIRNSLHQTFWKTRYFINVLQKKTNKKYFRYINFIFKQLWNICQERLINYIPSNLIYKNIPGVEVNSLNTC